MKELIKELSGMRGISGYEYRITEKIKEIFMPYADEVYTDISDNVIAVKKCGKPDAKRVMIEAHIDEIGLMVNEIDERGFIGVVNVGGVDPRILPACEVIVHGKRDVKGVIGAKPPHLMNTDDENKAYKMADMAVDTGLSPEEVREVIRVGDSITMTSLCCELLDGRLAGKSLDDRAGVAVLAKILKNLEKVNLEVDVYAVCAVKEEVGGFGAQTSTYAINPDIAVAIDVCHGITPDNSYCAYEVGGGAVVTIGPNIHPAISKRLCDIAEKNDIKNNIDIDGGNTGTDAWVMQVVRDGIPTGLLSIPLKYMHTSREVIDVSDAEAVSDMLTKFIQGLGDDMEEWLCL